MPFRPIHRIDKRGTGQRYIPRLHRTPQVKGRLAFSSHSQNISTLQSGVLSNSIKHQAYLANHDGHSPALSMNMDCLGRMFRRRGAV